MATSRMRLSSLRGTCFCHFHSIFRHHQLSFFRISIPSQGYLDVSSAQNPALSYGALGIVGLGFTSLSTIDALVNHTGAATGRSLLYNAFDDNKAEPNYIAFALQRSSDPNDDVQGTFSIGTVFSPIILLSRTLIAS